MSHIKTSGLNSSTLGMESSGPRSVPNVPTSSLIHLKLATPTLNSWMAWGLGLLRHKIQVERPTLWTKKLGCCHSSNTWRTWRPTFCLQQCNTGLVQAWLQDCEHARRCTTTEMRAHTPQQDQDIPRRRLSVTGGHRTSMGSTSIPVVQSRVGTS